MPAVCGQRPKSMNAKKKKKKKKQKKNISKNKK
jgi:hypothetical protein